ncbi:MAG TPA: stage V sporulation protein AB, partial [Candidatus Mediterraneibacter excrementigallinarum]|nr:stage V sporulation protein AB [Candidatus Mediterraneibacter excrementigallinarum]
MWVQQIFLAVVGLSAGVAAAGGLFSFIVELGVIADFADRTHTGDKVLFYEECTALGGILGNLVY